MIRQSSLYGEISKSASRAEQERERTQKLSPEDNYKFESFPTYQLLSLDSVEPISDQPLLEQVYDPSVELEGLCKLSFDSVDALGAE